MRLRNVALAAALAAVAGVALAQGAAQPAAPSAAQPSAQAATPPPGAAPCANPPCGPGPRHHMRNPGERMMMRLDTDRDGQVSRAEVQAAQQRQLERFDKADANGDGKLSRDEMRAMRDQWRGGMGHDHPCAPVTPKTGA